MSSQLADLAQRKQLLVARVQLQRMETVLRAAELREALRPTSMIGSAIAQPAAMIALVNTVAALFGLRRVARLARLIVVGLMVLRIARNWRGQRPAQQPPAAETRP